MDRHRPRRAGFTLVEILIVIVIIGILMALILPAIAAAFRRAKEAQVSAEMNNLATALASFRNAFGDYPPSRIVLCEGGMASLPSAFLTSTVPTLDGNDTDMTGQQLVNRSLIYLRKFWSRCDFINPGAGTAPGTFNDFNGNGIVDTGYAVLDGSECLAFFLGGIPIRSKLNPSDVNTTITGMGGFGKSPSYPFVIVSNAAGVPQNRTIPNYEFVNSRLIDFNGNGFPSYVDPYNTGPADHHVYAYFSSYGTNGYDPNDNNIAEEDEQSPALDVERGFSVGYSVYDSTGTKKPLAISPCPNPYTTGLEVSANGVSFINPSSFQLCSAGADRLWGLGGQYIPAGTGGGRLPLNPRATDLGNTNDEPTGIRLRESDNVTNFSGGRLD